MSTIADMKAQARLSRRTMDQEQSGVDCGLSILRTISSTFSEAESQYDAAVAWLSVYDPDFPKADKS